MTSDFILNKYWTFEDKDFSIKTTLKQFGKFASFSSVGSIIQTGLIFTLVEESMMSYPFAVITESFGNL